MKHNRPLTGYCTENKTDRFTHLHSHTSDGTTRGLHDVEVNTLSLQTSLDVRLGQRTAELTGLSELGELEVHSPTTNNFFFAFKMSADQATCCVPDVSHSQDARMVVVHQIA